MVDSDPLEPVKQRSPGRPDQQSTTLGGSGPFETPSYPFGTKADKTFALATRRPVLSTRRAQSIPF